MYKINQKNRHAAYPIQSVPIPDALRNEKYQEKNLIKANSKRQKTGLRSLSINVFGDFLYNENLNCHLHEHEKISANDIGTIKDMKKKVKIP